MEYLREPTEEDCLHFPGTSTPPICAVTHLQGEDVIRAEVPQIVPPQRKQSKTGMKEYSIANKNPPV